MYTYSGYLLASYYLTTLTMPHGGAGRATPTILTMATYYGYLLHSPCLMVTQVELVPSAKKKKKKKDDFVEE